MIGGEPHTQWLPHEIERDAQGFLVTGRDVLEQTGTLWDHDRDPLPLETSMSGVFAAGDVRQGSIKRVASAVGEGATVVRLVHEHLREAEPAPVAD
jgi:thioredoxin reductase (NADPH)